MREFIDSIFEQIGTYFDEYPIPTALVGLLAVAFIIWILRKVSKLVLVLILLGVAAIVVSYFAWGEKKTEKAIRKGTEALEEQIDRAEKVLDKVSDEND